MSFCNTSCFKRKQLMQFQLFVNSKFLQDQNLLSELLLVFPTIAALMHDPRILVFTMSFSAVSHDEKRFLQTISHGFEGTFLFQSGSQGGHNFQVCTLPEKPSTSSSGCWSELTLCSCVVLVNVWEEPFLYASLQSSLIMCAGIIQSSGL